MEGMPLCHRVELMSVTIESELDPISNAQLKLFDGTLMKPVGETTLTAERRGKRVDLRFQVVECSNEPLLSAERVSSWGF